MKRRTFGLLAGTSMMAVLKPGLREVARAADVSLLNSTLTPFGSERAGNAAGTIPAWTGGLTEIPAGIDWDPRRTLPPDFFAADAMLYEVNAGNLSQYAHLLTDGLRERITSVGFTMQVFPTHRTHAAPQWVYDNIAANVSRAKLDATGARFGFTGAFGGIPFPFLDSDPLVAGAQLQWNHEARWGGKYVSYGDTTCLVANGEFIVVSIGNEKDAYPYYIAQSYDEYNGYFAESLTRLTAPGNIAGGEELSWVGSDPFVIPVINWQVLSGQGRVRKAPSIVYDTPSSYANGAVDYDEYFGFTQQLDEYDWRFLGQREMLVPYNNNKAFHVTSRAAHGPKFIDPNVIRWELHRVNVVEITLHPGRRNVLPRRRLYYDEDTSTVAAVDAWDADGNLVRHTHLLNANFPNLPGTIYLNAIAYDIQQPNYVSITGTWGDAATSMPYSFDPIGANTWNPQAMAAAASY